MDSAERHLLSDLDRAVTMSELLGDAKREISTLNDTILRLEGGKSKLVDENRKLKTSNRKMMATENDLQRRLQTETKVNQKLKSIIASIAVLIGVSVSIAILFTGALL